MHGKLLKLLRRSRGNILVTGGARALVVYFDTLALNIPVYWVQTICLLLSTISTGTFSGKTGRNFG
jgi:hypothetical protein